MLRYSASSISLATIDPDIEPYHDDWEYETQPLALGSVRTQAAAEPEPTLCARCQDFDIQSFARGLGRRRGYLLKDVEAAAEQGCHFCGLLLDAAKDAKKPEYFYTNAFKAGRTTLNPELYVHMTISESYKSEALTTRSEGLRANRLLVELGDRFSGMRNPSNHEICIAADAGKYFKCTLELIHDANASVVRQSGGFKWGCPWALRRR